MLPQPLRAKARKGFNKMNDRKLENKVRQDTSKVKKDLNTLMDDGVALFGRFEDNVGQATGKAKEDLTTWLEESLSQLSEGFEKLTGDARETVVDAAATLKKDVGHGLSQYNAKVQEVAEKVPGGFSEKAGRYPWVAISIGLAFGLLVGVLLKPGRQQVG
jgi:ElaB/YqjD/DUF883 family membrane-anchored ribosome-binding protein